jgi:glycerol-3-phosphate acyltransferase PlsY
MAALFMFLFAYLLGSVPTGFLVGFISGIDVRKAGSGNVGATNVARVVGKREGFLTLLGDVAKGFIPTFLSLQLGFSEAITSLVGLGAFLGHLYPLFLRFQGGKGVATALGIFLALTPMAAALLVFVFALIAVVSRVVSLASIVAAGITPVALWLFAYPTSVIGLGLLVGFLVIFRHRENIERLTSGAEPRFNLW